MRKFSFLIVFLFILSGCARVKFQSRSDESRSISFTKQVDDNIEIRKKFVLDYFFWGITPGKRIVYVEDYLKGEGIKSASSLTVTLKRSLKSYFFLLSTLGIYYPVEGEIFLKAQRSKANNKLEHPILEGEERFY